MFFEECKIIDIEDVDCNDEYVYNLEVEDNHNYISNDILVSNCHCLRGDTVSKLLKTLEEPPPKTIFILCTTDPQKIIPTIKSRCQRFNFHKISTKDISEYLFNICKKENIKYNEEAMNMISRVSEGSLRDALNVLDGIRNQISPEEEISPEIVENTIGTTRQGFFFELMNYIIKTDRVNSIICCKKKLAQGHTPEDLFHGFLEYIHSMMLSKYLKSDKFIYIEDTIVDGWRKQRDSLDIRTLHRIFTDLENYIKGMTYKPRLDLSFDACLIKIIENMATEKS